MKLNLCVNYFRDEGAIYLSREIAKLKNLTDLNLNLGNNYIPQAATTIGREIAKLENLVTLNISLRQSNIGQEVASNFVREIANL